MAAGCPGTPQTLTTTVTLGTVDIVGGYPTPILASSSGPTQTNMETYHDLAYDVNGAVLASALQSGAAGSCSCCCSEQMTGPTFIHQWYINDDMPEGMLSGWANKDYWPGGSSGIYMNNTTSKTYHFNVGQHRPCEEIRGGLYSFTSNDDARCSKDRVVSCGIGCWTWVSQSTGRCGKSWGFQEPALAYALFGDPANQQYAAGGSAWDYRIRAYDEPKGGFEYLSLCLPCSGFEDPHTCEANCPNAQHYGKNPQYTPTTGPGYAHGAPYTVGNMFFDENCQSDPCSPNGLCYGPGAITGPGPTACFNVNSPLDGSGDGGLDEDNVCYDCEGKAIFNPCYDIDNPQTANNGSGPNGNTGGGGSTWSCNDIYTPGVDAAGQPLGGSSAYNNAGPPNGGGPELLAEYNNVTQDEDMWDGCCLYRAIGCVDTDFANYNPIAGGNGYDCEGYPDPNDDYTYYEDTGGGGCGCMRCLPVPWLPPGINNHPDLLDNVTGFMLDFDNPLVDTECSTLTGANFAPIHPLGWNNTEAKFTNIDCCSNAGCMDNGVGGYIWSNGPVNPGGPGPAHAPTSPWPGPGPYYPGYDVIIGNVSTPVSITQSPIAATNYSAQFIQDCSGNIPPGGPDPFGDTTCCDYDIPGCMDTASTGANNPDIFGNNPIYDVWNFNPYATIDDGSCFYDEPIGGCVDNGGPSSQPQLPSNVPVPPFWPQYPGIPAIDFNPNANIAINTCTWLYGCPDPYANNYDPCVDIPANAACLGTGTPHPIPPNDVYPVVALMSMCNYDIAGAGPGCMDPQALNYNPLSTQDCTFDVTYPANCLGGATGPYCCCLYPVDGCTDHNATNYNPLAVNDDGSCEYDISTTQEGINWLYGTKVLLCRDPLTKEEVLMGVCDQPEIQSEIFIERGKQSVMEPNLRLGEITTMGGLINHGYKYFRIKKQ